MRLDTYRQGATVLGGMGHWGGRDFPRALGDVRGGSPDRPQDLPVHGGTYPRYQHRRPPQSARCPCTRTTPCMHADVGHLATLVQPSTPPWNAPPYPRCCICNPPGYSVRWRRIMGSAPRMRSQAELIAPLSATFGCLFGGPAPGHCPPCFPCLALSACLVIFGAWVQAPLCQGGMWGRVLVCMALRDGHYRAPLRSLL